MATERAHSRYCHEAGCARSTTAHLWDPETCPTTESARCRPYRVYDRGEAWVQCDCGEAVTCGKGREFVGGDSSHRHTDDCLPLACPGVAFPHEGEHEHEWVQQIGPGMTSRHVCSVCRVVSSPGLQREGQGDR